MPSCLVIQHVEPERSYAIGDALVEMDVEMVVCRTYANDPLPQHIADFDGLVVMGGPMSAASDEGFPSRIQEMNLIAEAVKLGIPTLGICLGAQLMAAAVGGHVLARPAELEIGWAPVRMDADVEDDPLFSDAPNELTVLHWHGDTYELPPEAVHLASSDAYGEQAFRIGDRAWGLQFHLEVDEKAVESFLSAFGDEAIEAGTSVTEIRSNTPTALARLIPHRDKVLSRFAAFVALRAVADEETFESASFPPG